MDAFRSALLLTLLVAPGSAAGERRVAEFELTDHRGATTRLTDGEARAVVVVFLGVECPLANLYAQRLAELHAEFAPRGIRFLAVNSNRHDGPAALSRFAREHKLPFPYLKDPGAKVADDFGAERTPEAFVLDADRRVRYRGRIDDQFTPGRQKASVTSRDLANVLNELLAGKPVSVPETPAVGCRIGRDPRPSASAGVTYTRDVAPILQRHCQSCHRPNQVAPFALTTYEDAKSWSGTITEVVAEGRMPPWHANPAHGRFANDPRLGNAAKAKIAEWVRLGCPEGDPVDLPPAQAFPEGWSIPVPDRVIAMPEPFRVPAEGIIDYQYVEIDPGFAEDVWVSAAEVRPGNRRVVHHCMVFLRPPGVAGTDAWEAGELGSFCLAGFAPGTPPMTLPDGMAKRIPAGWRLLFVLHYTSVGTPQEDRTAIGLKIVPASEVHKEAATRILRDDDLHIPPYAPAYRVEKQWLADRDYVLLALSPHMHLRGKSFRYDLTYPDGSAEVLLDVSAYDFNWQHRYVLAEPTRVPAGSTLRCKAVYDNSADNPANPDPSATVVMGRQNTDEMFNGYFELALADQDLVAEASARRTLWRVDAAVVALAVALVVRRRIRTRK
jgi:peroxiredoxin